MRPLTDIAIANLKPRAVRYEVPDAGARGLKVIVQPSGYKSFAVRYHNAGGRKRKLTLPAGITLAAARKLTADAMLELAQGRDPATAKKAAKRAAAIKTGDTIERWAGTFIERHAKKHTRPNSWRQTVHVFDDIVLPAWKGRLVHELERRDIRELGETLAENKPIMANRTHGVLSKFFGWLCERDVIAASPMVGVKRPAPERVRDRALDDGELVRLWAACDAIGGAAGACFKVLLLTGQRRSEIAGLRWSEIKGDTIELPAARMKGKQAHVVPLSSQAAAVIASMPRRGDYVFGGKAPLGHFDRIKRALDEHTKLETPWVTHDLRRSAASALARLHVQLPVIEKLLAHKSGTFKGIVGVYQRHTFLPEMAVAVQKLGDHIQRLVTGKVAEVVRLPQR
jgi:integrase